MNNPQMQNSPGGNGIGGASPAEAGDVKSSVGAVAQQAKEQGQEKIESARTTTADTLEKLADGVRDAASELERDGTVGNLSSYIVKMAEGMTSAASGLRDKSGDDLVREVGRLARENPSVFVAGAVALGFGLTRFARATTSREQDATAASLTGLQSSALNDGQSLPTGTTPLGSAGQGSSALSGTGASSSSTGLQGSGAVAGTASTGGGQYTAVGGHAGTSGSMASGSAGGSSAGADTSLSSAAGSTSGRGMSSPGTAGGTPQPSSVSDGSSARTSSSFSSSEPTSGSSSGGGLGA